MFACVTKRSSLGSRRVIVASIVDVGAAEESLDRLIVSFSYSEELWTRAGVELNLTFLLGLMGRLA